MTFDAQCCKVLCNGKIMARGVHEERSLYKLQGDINTVEQANIAQATPSLETWHCRLGHVNYATFVDMAQRGLVTGMCIDLSTLPPIC